MDLGQIAVLVWAIEKLSPRKEEPKGKVREIAFKAPSVWGRKIGFILFLVAIITAIVLLLSGRFFFAFFAGFMAPFALIIPCVKSVSEKE